ncbi:Uncharacterized protein PBTT_00521 [Plasmodiophora brassicae]
MARLARVRHVIAATIVTVLVACDLAYASGNGVWKGDEASAVQRPVERRQSDIGPITPRPSGPVMDPSRQSPRRSDRDPVHERADEHVRHRDHGPVAADQHVDDSAGANGQQHRTRDNAAVEGDRPRGRDADGQSGAAGQWSPVAGNQTAADDDRDPRGRFHQDHEDRQTDSDVTVIDNHVVDHERRPRFVSKDNSMTTSVMRVDGSTLVR